MKADQTLRAVRTDFEEFAPSLGGQEAGATAADSVLVIEDEPQTRTHLRLSLEQRGYRCLCASSGAEGIAAAIDSEPKLILLDLDLFDLDGMEVMRRIRRYTSAPILVVSARGQTEAKVEALDGGANDYVTKPFEVVELLARIRVALRTIRSTGRSTDTGVFTVGDLTVDFDLRRVTVRGVEVHLTPTEYRLLSVMIGSANRVLSNRQILRDVWGAAFEDRTGNLRIYMKHLRDKIEPEPAQPKYLVNVPGVGYRLKVRT